MNTDTLVSAPLTSSCAWREEDGVIRFTVVSDGTTGKGWISRMHKNDIAVGDMAEELLLSSHFKPTKGVVTHVAVLKGTLFDERHRITRDVRTAASLRRLAMPNPEVSCLIREAFTNAEIRAMGLSLIVVMHEPIKEPEGALCLLGVDCDDVNPWIESCSGKIETGWHALNGFAFAASQRKL